MPSMSRTNHCITSDKSIVIDSLGIPNGKAHARLSRQAEVLLTLRSDATLQTVFLRTIVFEVLSSEIMIAWKSITSIFFVLEPEYRNRFRALIFNPLFVLESFRFEARERRSVSGTLSNRFDYFQDLSEECLRLHQGYLYFCKWVSYWNGLIIMSKLKCIRVLSVRYPLLLQNLDSSIFWWSAACDNLALCICVYR